MKGIEFHQVIIDRAGSMGTDSGNFIRVASGNIQRFQDGLPESTPVPGRGRYVPGVIGRSPAQNRPQVRSTLLTGRFTVHQ